jgi:hypothetical protein
MNSPLPPSVALIGVIITLVLISWHGLSGPLVFDDLTTLAPIADESRPDYQKFIFNNASGLFGRAVSMSTFAVNHRLRGSFRNFELKATNLAIHIANGLVLYCLLLVLLPRVNESSHYRWMAVLISALWLLSPINSGVVFYVVQRMALLACFFAFVGILCYALWRRGGHSSPIVKYLYLALCLACWPLAFLSKENGILLPFLILIIELEFFSRGKSFRVLRAILLSSCVAAIIAVYVFQNHELLSYAGRSFTLVERLSTQPVVVAHYIRDLLIPVSADIGIFNDDFRTVTSYANFATTGASAAILFMLGFCFLSPEKSANRGVRAGILFYFFAHALESTAIPLEMYFEHRNYLPSAGIYLAAVLAGQAAITRYKIGRIFTVLFPVCVLAWFTFLSYHKAQAWSSWPQVVMNIYQHHPRSARAGLEMASVLTDSNEVNAALKVNALNALYNPTRNLNIKLQRFYIFCASGNFVDETEYAALTGPIYPGNGLGAATAFDLLFEVRDRNSCPNVDFDRVMNRISEMLDASLESQLITTKQAWHIEYYLIELDRSSGRRERALSRAKRSNEGGNVKAEYYYREVLRGH